MRSRFYSDFPMLFHPLPLRLRLEIVRTALGPSGGWFARDMVIGKVPLNLGCTPERAHLEDGMVHLKVRDQGGAERELQAEHVIAATGYKVNLDRLRFLSQEIRSKLKAVQRTPVLSTSFESSVPGLYFVGVSAANSFGPVMRFAFGASFAARTVTEAVRQSLSREPARMPVRSSVASTAE